jgi:hypothetical protein
VHSDSGQASDTVTIPPNATGRPVSYTFTVTAVGPAGSTSSAVSVTVSSLVPAATQHEDRWMSQGQPTKLVRDAGTESYDPPQDLPLPDELVPVPDDDESADSSDLRRYGDSGEEPYSTRRAKQAGIDAISGGVAIVDEPSGNW